MRRWDLPTRVFHWLLAGSFAGAFLTAGSARLLDVHLTLGYTILGLIAFRLLWGLIGTRYARFSSYEVGARSVIGYLKSLFTRSPRHYLGHNPAASWAIYGLRGLSKRPPPAAASVLKRAPRPTIAMNRPVSDS